MIGQKLGHYEILEKLGEGGMGVVYKARDRHLDRLVAIKVLPEEKLADADRLRRFTQEARTASALNHPNIITIHDVASEAGTHYIVMEYVRGKTLDQLIPRKGMRLTEVLKIAIQVADAVAAAAAAGVVHRDLKPGNIMAADSGLVKVLDFGLAKLAEQVDLPSEEMATVAMTDETANTQHGTIVGTLSYMSPEQAEGKAIDARSDIFSFGAVLYEMVTGQRAFSAGTKMSTLSAVIRDDPKPASALAPDTPRDLEKIISRCLRKDAERRFQHMSDVRVALVELKEESESGTLTPQLAPARHRERRWLIAAAAVVVLAAGGGLVWRSLRRPGASTVELEPRQVPFMSSGRQSNPTFSPDGNQIAFAWSGDPPGTSHIYVKMIGTETPLRLTSGDLPDDNPAWAPDGKSIVFLRRISTTRTGIYQVPPLGGAERRIAEIGRIGLSRTSWTPDSKWVAVTGTDAGESRQRTFLISVETAEKRALTSTSGESDVLAELAPDGRSLAFSRTLGESRNGLFVLSLDAGFRPAGEPREIPAPPGNKNSLTWTPDGKEIIFTNSATELFGTLFRVPVSGDAPARRISFGDGSRTPAVHGNRLAFVHSFNDSNIWKIAVSGPGGKAEVPAPLIMSTRVDIIHPHGFSPDGRRIAFESSRSGPYGIWMTNADGSNPAFLLGADYIVGSPAWSPDSRSIAFDTRKDGNVEIYLIPAEGGVPKRLTNHAKDDMVPAWSHDGKWIYFVSNRTGRFEIFKMPAAGGDAVQVTRNGGFAARESPDGKFVYYTRDRAYSTPLLRVSVDGGEETKVLDTVNERNWDVVAEGIWFMEARRGQGATLRFLRFADGKITELTKTPLPTVNGISVSPDGLTVLYTQLDHTGTELMLIENFR